MFWAEIKDLTGWLVKFPGFYIPGDAYGVILDYFPQEDYPELLIYKSSWQETPKEAIKAYKALVNNTRDSFFTSKGVARNEHIIPLKYVGNPKTAAPESYTSGSDVDQSEFKDLNFWSQEEKNLPFPKDEFSVGEDSQEFKNKTKVYQELDEEQGYAYNGIQANLLGLSWNLNAPTSEQIMNARYGDIWRIEFEPGYYSYIGIVKVTNVLKMNNNVVVNFKGYNSQLDNIFGYFKSGANPISMEVDSQDTDFEYIGNIEDFTQESNLKLSWNELPKAEETTQYDINPLTEINMYPSRRKDRQDPVKYRNEKTDSEMLFEKGLHETIERPETSRDLITYAKLSWKLRGTDNLLDMKEGEIWKGIYPPYDDIMYILPTSQLKITYDETSYPHISFYGFDGFSIEELEYQFQNRSPYFHQMGGLSFRGSLDKKLPEYERIGDYREVFSFLENKKLSWKEPENLEGWLVKKRRPVGTPLYGIVIKDEYNKEDNLHVLYARWSDEEWPEAEEQALSKFNHYGWESLSLKNYPITKDEDISLIRYIGMPKQSSQNQNSLFIYIKPDENLPLEIKQAHTTVIYLRNSIEDGDREKVINNISNLLKDYKTPECSFGGVATFDNEDKSRVILINFENGAKLYSDLINILSKYIEINKNYDFIPHMTIDKDLEIDELPDYKWKPNVLYIEWSKDIPAITIEFETGKVGESQNLDETSNLDVRKLSWQEFTKRLLDSEEGDIWEQSPHDPFNREDFLIVYKVENSPDSNILEGIFGKSVDITGVAEDTLESALDSWKNNYSGIRTLYETDANNYKFIGNVKDFL